MHSAEEKIQDRLSQYFPSCLVSFYNLLLVVSLNINYQCNTRSGHTVEYDQTIYDCGFFYEFPK